MAKALKEPTFIIEHQGALYVTDGVFEYRDTDAKTADQKAGVAALRKLYNDTRSTAGASAAAAASGQSQPQPPPVPITRKAVIAFMATKPPQPPGG
jgi:hypothetical protein